MTICTTDELPAGEWARDPRPLREEAFRDGWLQRLGGRPLYHLRYLTPGELAAWDAGHAAARLSLVCVRQVGESLQPADLLDEETVEEVAAAELAVDDDPPLPDLPFVELAPAPMPPYFDGSQVCSQVDPELFFPENGSARSERSAKRLCAGCEFLNPCRRYGMTTRIGGRPIFGIWGGTSERDRRALRLAAAGVALDVDEDQGDDEESFDERLDVAL